LSYVDDPENYTIILRFLGTTPSTSNIHSTFNSVFYQLSKIFSIPMPKRVLQLSYIDLKLIFLRQLNLILEIYPTKKVVILLDSLDQLNPYDYALDWSPEKLPPNTKIIYSVIPDHGKIQQRFEAKENTNPNNFIEITSLDTRLAKLILEDFLKSANRTLSAEQWSVLEDMFAKATLFPLYVTLIFDIVAKWPSFYEVTEKFTKCLTIDQCIEYLFTILEIQHGKLLFSRSIIYLSLFKNGISESEIEDILSLDDEVLFDVFEFHAPPIRKLPAALWSRIKHELNGYMVEKEVHDTRVIYWYHRRFIEVANSFYIDNLKENTRNEIFSNVIDFYSETWKNKPKPYKYNDFLAKKKRLEGTDAAEKRETAIQPTCLVIKFEHNNFFLNMLCHFNFQY
jgi:hypothetical protein